MDVPLKTYRLSDTLRACLKHPLGELLKGSSSDVMEQFSNFVKETSPTKIFAVGDVVATNLLKYGIAADTYIVDNRVMRKAISPIPLKVEKVIHVKNPPGTITPKAWEAISVASRQNTVTKIEVDGEEDLLVLPMVLNAPDDAIVVYGQPHEGMVVILTTKEKKTEIASIIEAMAV
jgi:hypothetical protein